MIMKSNPYAEYTESVTTLEQVTEQEQAAAAPAWNIRRAADVPKEEIHYLWQPYILRGDVTIIAAAGGTGKTFALCGIAAELSRGRRPMNPFDTFQPARTLFISAEDPAFILADRMKNAGANLDLVEILDATDSVNLTLSDENGRPRLHDLESIIAQVKPDLVIIDPLHAYIGGKVKMTEQSAIRPFMQGLANLAKQYDCAIVDVAHTSKKRAEDNANDAILGATDIVNASRGVLRVITDETGTNPARRVIVHTKANYSALGQSIAFEIDESGALNWAGFSEVTKSDMEDAARHGSSVTEFMQNRAARKKGQEYVADKLEELAIAQPEKKRFYAYKGTLAQYGINGQADIIPCLAELNRRGILVTFPENARREQGSTKQLRGIELTRTEKH